jgi:prefoldin subunit 5
MFAKGLLLKQDKILVEVGAGAIVDKELAEAEKILEAREKDIRTNMTNFQQLLATFEKQYNELADKVRSFTG